LDLSLVIIVYRFISPEWLRILKRYLAGITLNLPDNNNTGSNRLASSKSKGSNTKGLFTEIITLGVREVLLFSPSAIIGLDIGNNGIVTLEKLGNQNNISPYLELNEPLRVITIIYFCVTFKS
jgi:hypothetical protein